MEKVHDFILKVRKGQKEMHEKKAKETDPFGTKDVAKQKIPKQMQNGDLKEGMVQLSIRRVQEHDESDKHEKAQLEKVRCFMTNVK